MCQVGLAKSSKGESAFLFLSERPLQISYGNVVATVMVLKGKFF